ncbi:DUF1836 domain-containing protein [Planococcus sp. ISL-109]|uniref:DUF1836 domain-containing protein n=1 Tax=Planococcus sp. ISL-109 TaxID=2819166 RepID=UPI001BE4FFD0|nr:DUF1836 domain-containing protein [Planococcus sp. ISL-109]MBT2581395.1 DUF1836 domain-containing protein [Planococcus sp. ISL-109]
MENIDKLIGQLALDSQIHTSDIPKIDLYVDQVIQLFETSFHDTKRFSDDKILTKTMINNYAKGKLFYPVQHKKYTPDHIMLINLIYQMKSTLSINDVKKVLEKVNEKAQMQELDLSAFYETYLALQQDNQVAFREEVERQAKAVENTQGEADEELSKVLFIASLVHKSNLYRRAAEKLADELVREQADGKSTY